MTLSYKLPSVLNAATAQSQDTLKPLEIPLPGTDCKIGSQVPLARLTSFRVGGPAEWYVAPRRLEEMLASLEWAKSQQLPITVLGAGSNLLVSDRGIPGMVICTRNLEETRFDPETGQVTSCAGKPIAQLARAAAKRGWQGLEWAIGIPGTVGGAVVMNAGAHKYCTADILVNTQVLSPNGTIEQLAPLDLGYSYRTSNLQGGSRLVTQATFQLRPGADPAEVMAATEQDLKQRHATQPYNRPSCGSVFRNPQGHYAAKLIELTGLKGYRLGGAQVAELHANFILNCDGATASDVFRIIRYVQQQVEQRWGLLLEPEVRMLGDFQLA